MRVISLLASGTEIVCALGAGDALVGRSHECDNPEWVRKLPACTRAAFDVSMSSGKIDAEVRRRLKLHEPLYHVDADLIRELCPDLLITQAHCEVCAVTPGDVERVGCGILSSQVLALGAGTVEGIFDGVMSIARGMDLLPAGEDLVAKMRSDIRAVTDAVREKPAPTVVMLEWTDPIFSMGNWGPELVEAANVPAPASTSSGPQLPIEKIGSVPFSITTVGAGFSRTASVTARMSERIFATRSSPAGNRSMPRAMLITPSKIPSTVPAPRANT